MSKKILLIAVNYNSPKETIDLVNSIEQLKNKSILQVVIVENSDFLKRDTNLQKQCNDILPNLLYIETPSNYNYFGSVNYSLKELQLNPILFDFFIISNVDIIIPKNSFLLQLLKLNGDNIGIFAPSIISKEQGVNQNPYLKKRFKKYFLYYYFIIRQLVLFSKIHEIITTYIKRKRKVLIKYIEPPGFIYSPHGAFIIFTNLYFKCGGSIDFGMNLFGEELFVAEECLNIKLKVFFEPSIEVLHNEHVSTGAVSSKFIVKKTKQSVLYFLKNFK